jgi:small subunit ribosomal protein S7
MSEESKIKLFDKYDFDSVEVYSKSLQVAISVKPIFVPHSAGRHEHWKFSKNKVNVVERLVNHIALTPKAGGKKYKAINAVKAAFEIVHHKTGKNPILVLVKAIENAAPREDTTRISYGGILYYQSVDISPTRRVDLAIRNIVTGARNNSFKSPKPFHEALSDEIIAASENNPKSYAIAKRQELEKHAEASR